MKPNKAELYREIRGRLAGATGLAIMGVGYELGSDDGAGLAAARRIQERLPHLPVFLTGSAPENYTGPVVKHRPSHVVFLDAAALDGDPGDVALIDPEQIKGVTFSTHTLPLATIMDYLSRSIGAKSFAIGIQPLHKGFGEEISAEVQRAAELVGDVMVEVVEELNLTRQ